jgi:tRNA-2-methylthio-N6-dimethylallyladenosine synthase
MSTLEAGPRRLHVITWGCQMNVYDSARMADVLAPLGYAPAPVPEVTWDPRSRHIRDKAAEKVFCGCAGSRSSVPRMAGG